MEYTKKFSERKLPFAVTGRQEIVQEESIVDFSTILRYNNYKLYITITCSLIMTNGWVSMIDRASSRIRSRNFSRTGDGAGKREPGTQTKP